MPHLLHILVGRGNVIGGNLRAGFFRPLVVVHHHRHRRGHTPCERLLSLPVGIGTVVGRHVVPVRLKLVPVGLEQRFDSFARGTGLQSAPAHAVCELLRVAQRRHGLVVALQPCPHVVWHPVPVDGACGAVAQHG